MVIRIPVLVYLAFLTITPLVRDTLQQILAGLAPHSIGAAPIFAWAPAVPGRQAHDTPFLYKGPGGWRHRFAPEALREWAAAVQHHSPGAADESLRTIAAWPYARLAGAIADADALRALVRQRRGYPDPGASSIRIRGYEARLSEALELLQLSSSAAAAFDLTGLFKRAAVLHTDIALVRWTASERADVWTESSAASFHLGIANAMIDRLRVDGHDAFARLWYRAMAALLHSRHEVVVQPTFLESTLTITKDDPEVLLMAGALRELLASSRMEVAPSPARRISRQAHLREAERLYRRVLNDDGRSTEARVRLARVLVQMERPEAASEMLSTVEIAGRSPIAYFAHLIRGEADEALGRFDAARSSYSRALEMYPNAVSGALALSHLARRQGDRAGAALPVVQMLESTGSPAGDPWTGYFVAGDGRRAEALLAVLRAAVQGKSDDPR
jgi:tetratricopeptide (TPR) repeat protein